MVPLGFSWTATGGPWGKSTCAVDSIVTAVVTIKMMSSTRKISVNGVMLISANTPPPWFRAIVLRSASTWRWRSTARRQLRYGDRDRLGACLLGLVQDTNHIAKN